MEPLEHLNQRFRDLHERVIALAQGGVACRELHQAFGALLTSIRGLNECRGKSARLSGLVDILVNRLAKLELLIEAGEVEMGVKRITLAAARTLAFANQTAAEERRRKFAADEAEKGSDG